MDHDYGDNREPSPGVRLLCFGLGFGLGLGVGRVRVTRRLGAGLEDCESCSGQI